MQLAQLLLVLFKVHQPQRHATVAAPVDEITQSLQNPEILVAGCYPDPELAGYVFNWAAECYLLLNRQQAINIGVLALMFLAQLEGQLHGADVCPGARLGQDADSDVGDAKLLQRSAPGIPVDENALVRDEPRVVLLEIPDAFLKLLEVGITPAGISRKRLEQVVDVALAGFAPRVTLQGIIPDWVVAPLSADAARTRVVVGHVDRHVDDIAVQPLATPLHRYRLPGSPELTDLLKPLRHECADLICPRRATKGLHM